MAKSVKKTADSKSFSYFYFFSDNIVRKLHSTYPVALYSCTKCEQ